jgi:flagellar basal-body rod modification protein FlgD
MIQSLERLEGQTAGTVPQTAKPDALANKEVFLQLLVAQIQNQDPLNPSDSIEFLTQLSQFTQVEQTLGMRDDLRKILGAIEALKPAATGA